MPTKEKISNNQFLILIILFTIGTSSLIAPPLLVGAAKQDAWLSSIIGMGCGLLFGKLYGMLALRYPNLTLAEYSEKILGKWIGKTVSFLFFLYYLILTAGLLRIIGDLLTTHILTETPIQAIEILFLLTVIMGVRLGIETIARTSEMLLPYVLIFFVLLVLFLMPQIEVENISPFLENGMNPVLRGTFRTLGVPFLDLVVFLMIAPSVVAPKRVEKTMLIGVLVGGFILLLITLLSILVLGSDLTSRLNYPTFVLAEKIDIGNFIQRIEILSGAMMFISLFIKISICFYSLVLSIAQPIQLKNDKILTFPLGILVITMSISFFPNIVYFYFFLSKAWTPITIIYGLILPLLLLVVDTIKSKLVKMKSKPL
ncbi:GerAB/ArcD/ProY family transporter [Bacillus sp. 1NLA3E]|uniref:GerAB/ArcD/ProY family transporter n=1 Tax=Bacillus sp. 1NLA3E TaxID=666686 RepID=UPI000247EACE|nr:endospore germination permease [Bacillus sp. 1NLA3E]AGK53404.1 spore germination protein [Bacillus sp. 1NLA3E]